MGGPERPIWFAGDLADPWVEAIVNALPRDARRVDCPLGLPEDWPTGGPSPRTLVIHRSHLTVADAQSLTSLRARCELPPRVVLCVGPHARYVDVDRWSRAVEVILPEATAAEVIARHATPPALRPIRPDAPRSRIVVVSGLHDLRLTLADVLRMGGYTAEMARDWSEAPPGLPVIWDVPVLEPGWARLPGERVRASPVVALLGFADRATVAQARAIGVAACLDSSCEIEDLFATLDRVSGATIRAEPAHLVPPAPRLHAPATHLGVAGRGSRS